MKAYPMSKPQPTTIFETASAVHSTVSAMPRDQTEHTQARELSPAARAVTEQPHEPAYSPIVLAGLVRLIEAALVVGVGFAVYVAYVVPSYGFAWYYFAAIFGIALLAMLAFQVADIYQVQAFRGHEKQYMRLASAWSVVFLIAIGVSFFAKMLKTLWVLPVDIRLSAHTNKLRFRPRSYSYIGNVAVLDMFDKPIADWDVVMKWLFDKIVGSLALLCALPIMAIIAIAIKLDSRGPVLFKQKRYGFNNELVEIYKFRSMYVDQADVNADKLVTVDDPRVTRVGRFIRKTSLDELPQLFNVVFAGNLSLVGPRPHALQAKAADRLYDEAVDGYFARHRVKPGITGWAQIHGWRGETNSQEKIQQRVEHDLYYIENWSILLDIYILLRTPFALLRTENAY